MAAVPAQRKTRNKISTPLGDLLPSHPMVTFTSELLVVSERWKVSFMGVLVRFGNGEGSPSFIHQLQSTLPLECSPWAVVLLDEEESAIALPAKNG